MTLAIYVAGGGRQRGKMMAETTILILEETKTTPGGATATRRMEVQCTPDQVAMLLAGRLPMLPEPTPEPKLRTWDDCLPEILRRQERIRERQEERVCQTQRAICAPSRSLLQDFYEMIED